MALDPHYILMQDLEQYFVDKDTGLPLANGEIWFYADTNRNSLKAVYELTGSPPNYTYSALPNPITLSAVGTVQDANGDNVAIYYLPYSNVDPSQIELYYIAVFRQGEGPNGVPQFTREAWPNISSSDNPVTSGEGSPTNEISNSQFVEVLFDPDEILTIAYGGIGTKTVEIAPDWSIEIQHTGNGNVTISRQLRTGSSLTPTNAPYVLQVIGGTNIATLKLIQRLPENPGIWSPVNPNVAGYVNAGILVGPNTPQLTVSYKPSVGTEQVLLTSTPSPGSYTYNTITTQLIPSDNTSTPTTGYVDIVINLAPLGTSLVSSVQIVGLDTNTILPYEQQPVNRQQDYLSHYYQPKLAYKPIPSYLIGWDFPLNPAQLGATQVQTAIGANKSKYIWDQTIVFQSADSGVAVARGPLNELELTAVVATKMAIVQYIDRAEALKLLEGKMSVYVSGSTSVAGGVSGTIGLYWTEDASLPSAIGGTNNSLVLTLDAEGKVATFNGAWNQVARNDLGDASITLPATDANTFAELTMSGWDVVSNTDIDGVTYFAIVIGFQEIPIGETVNINSVGLYKGDIASPPASATFTETLLNCQRFYWKTFLNDTAPAQNAGVGTGEYNWGVITAGGGTVYAPGVIFPTQMRATPTLTFYNPSAANASIRQISAPAGDISAAAPTDISAKGFALASGAGGSSAGVLFGVHITADARLGIVN